MRSGKPSSSSLLWRGKRFLRIRASLFAYFGAFIVFTTFLVKEEVRDHERDAIDDVRDAQSEFASDYNSDAILGFAERSQLEVENTIRELQLLPPNQSSARARKARVKEAVTRVETFGRGVAQVEALAYVLSDSTEIRKMLKNVSARHDEFEMTLHRDVIAALMSDRDADSEMAGLAVENVETSAGAYSSAVDDAIELVISQAIDERSAHQRLYEMWTTVSYILYPVGWLLAFIGSVFGKKISEE